MTKSQKLIIVSKVPEITEKEMEIAAKENKFIYFDRYFHRKYPNLQFRVLVEMIGNKITIEEGF